MDDKTAESRYMYKKIRLEKECAYGHKHFCDGTPNISVNEKGKAKPPCPNFEMCELRRVKIFF